MAESFRDALRNLINRHSMENGSDTPDHLLAEYLCCSLANYEMTIKKRNEWNWRNTPEASKLESKTA